MITTFLAHADPAGGAAATEIAVSGAIGAVGAAVLAVIAWGHRTGRFSGLQRLADLATNVPRFRGLPPWAALPAGLTSGSLLIAVFGFYWDVATHIDNGRDAGPFANPAHYFILFGLLGIALAGYVAVVIGVDDEHPRAITIRPGWRAPIGGLLLAACGTIALAGFPLDDLWHRLFGQDVTLWGPTHIQMIAGASLATLATWVLLTEAERLRPGTNRPRVASWMLGAAFLVGLSTLQAEFDYGVPQFRLLYQPVLLAIAAGIGLVAARLKFGAGGALAAAVGFIVIRGGLALAVGPLLGRSVPHFPLFLVEALVVEVVAAVARRHGPVRVGALAGAGIGTIGLAAEWAWSHTWMPLPWPTSLVAEALPWTIAAGTAAGVVGGLIGRALAGDARPVAAPARPLRVAGALAGVVLVGAIGWPLATNPGDSITASVRLDDVETGPARTVAATVRLDPPDAADDADFFTVTAWQGRDWHDGGLVLDDLTEVEPGVWRTTEPIPVHGDWKALLRLHDGRTLAAAPIYMPHDEAIGAEEIPAATTFTRTFVSDKELLQREFTGNDPWKEALAYSLLAAIGVGWILLNTWGVTRLLSVRTAEVRVESHAGRAIPASLAGAAGSGEQPVRSLR